MRRTAQGSFKRSLEDVYALVKDDLNRISWWGLDDPLAIESLLIELRPARGQNDARRSLQVSTTWSWRTREEGKHRTCLIQIRLNRSLFYFHLMRDF